MTNVQEAAARLRRLYSGAPSQCVYGTENAIESVALKRADKDAVIAAFLELVPADDADAITEAWLRSAAGADGKTTFYFGEQLLVYISGEGHWCAIVGSNPRRVPYAAGAFRLRDRGQLRLLCRALGIPLTESPGDKENTK